MKTMLLTILSILLAVSCGPEQQPQPEHVSLSADKTTLEFTAEGGEQTVVVTTSEKLYIVTGETWLKAKQGTKSADHKIEVTFTATANEATAERTARVSLVAGEEKTYLDVTQEAAEKKDAEDMDVNDIMGLFRTGSGRGTTRR